MRSELTSDNPVTVATPTGQSVTLSRAAVRLLLGHFSSVPFSPRAQFIAALTDGSGLVRLTPTQSAQLRNHVRSFLHANQDLDRSGAIAELYSIITS